MSAVSIDAPAATVALIGVRFRRAGRLYYFDPLTIPFRLNEYAIVETPRGLAAARVVIEPMRVASADLHGPLKPVIRKASSDDLVQMAAFHDQEPAAERVFAEKIRAFQLPIQPVKAEYNFDGTTLTLHFATTHAQLDFTALVTDLATTFRTRVELRQVGPRERARIRTGMGRCGRELCCATFLTELDTVTLRMAKDQNLPLNPNKISGVCGRLLCCLQYEHEGYVADKMAREGELGGGGCATSGKCESCGVHDLKAALGQPVAPGYGPAADAPPTSPSGEEASTAAPADDGSPASVGSPGPAQSRRRWRRHRRRGHGQVWSPRQSSPPQG
ncbi:MAG: hypothetical protein FJ029_05965 [Actinobacteria bacterium]|nr:hypothetical protein [Actinomycetota bacterium]